MDNLTTLLVIGFAVAFGLLFMFFIFGLGRVFIKDRRNREFQQIIESITKFEVESEREEAGLPNTKTWFGYWQSLALKGGSKFPNPNTPGLLAIGFPAVLFGIGFLIWPGDILGGLAGYVIGTIALYTFYQARVRARLALMNRQLPDLLSGIQASLQAGFTPQQAIMAQAKELPLPLGSELAVLNEEIEVGVPLDQALVNLASRVPSREMHFLIAATRIAIASGAELGPLIRTIQAIVVERTRIANLLATAVAKVQPTLWVAGLIIPAGFLWSFYSSETNREFWLSFPLGFGAIAIVAFSYALGMFLTKLQIDRVKKA